MNIYCEAVSPEGRGCVLAGPHHVGPHKDWQDRQWHDED